MGAPDFLLALLLVALLSTVNASLVPRRMMLEDVNPCEQTCEKQWSTGMAKCKAKRTAIVYGLYSYVVTAVDSVDLTRKTMVGQRSLQSRARPCA
jgi:hypothetical protein